MPLLRRQPFTKQNPPGDLQPNEEVFHCTLTNEIFRDYEEFFERIILCNSLVWTCSITGRPGLTYQEALESEERARKQLSSFPEYLQRPILYVASLTHRSRLNDMNDDVFVYAKDRYFIGEMVEVFKDGDRITCKVLSVLPPAPMPSPIKTNGDVIVIDDDDDDEVQVQPKSSKEGDKKKNFGADPSMFKYEVLQPKQGLRFVAEAGDINRKKGLYTREKSKLFLKQHCSAEGDGVWKVGEKFMKKMKLRESKFENFFNGPPPAFAVSQAKRKPGPKKAPTKGEFFRKQEKLEKKKKKEEKLREKAEKKELKKEMKEAAKQKKKQQKQQEMQMEAPRKRLTPEEKEALKLAKAMLREKEKEKRQQERQAQKEELRKLLEEEKLRRKEERTKEREKKMEEKRQRDEYLKEWSKPRDDLECDDLKDMPVPAPVHTHIPTAIFGDAVMVLEFLKMFGGIFGLTEEFPNGIHLDDFGKCILENDPNGLFFDLVKFLLMSIFDLQQEEEEEEEELEKENRDTDRLPEGFDSSKAGDVSTKDLVRAATVASQWPQLYHGCALSKVHLDGFTLTEVLRLHFLSSGAKASESNCKFRYQQRGGFTSLDDAGLEFRKEEPEIMRALSSRNVFDLPPADKLKIMSALINQLLTYVACRDMIEDNLDKLRQTRMDLKQHQWAEQRREKDEATFWYKKRLEERAKERELEAERKAQKKKEREDKLRAEEEKKKGKDSDVEIMDVDPAPSTSDAQDSKENKVGGAQAKKEELEPERRSARQKAVLDLKEKDMELPVENIDWEKLSAHDKMRMKERYLEKEKELSNMVLDLQHGTAIYPLGRDRVFRRYWIFRSIPGLFVEDMEEHTPDDYFQPVAQSGTSNSWNDSLPLNSSGKLSGEEKSTSSDKENESFDASGPKTSTGAASTSTVNVLKSDSGNTISVEEEPSTADTSGSENTQGVKSEMPMEVDKESQDSTLTVYDLVASRNKTSWAYYSTAEELDKLIDSLNPRGYREGALKQALLEQRTQLTASIRECPKDQLTIPDAEKQAADKQNVRYQSLKSRNRLTQGAVQGGSAQELLELNLREMLLDIEERIYVGSLGAVKVTDRKAWRDAIESGSFKAMCSELELSGKNLVTQDNGHIETERQDGDKVGDTVDDDDDTSSTVVQDLATALLQVERGIDPRFLSKPLGEDDETKKAKQKAALEAAFKGLDAANARKNKKSKAGAKSETLSPTSSDNEESDTEEDTKVKKTAKERWEEGLMLCSSLPQVFLHLATLEQSITWTKSALHARCRICRRKGDGDKMLLCDGCDRGHHMFCLKPPVKQIPAGDWFCPGCKPKTKPTTPRKPRRKSFFDEEEEEEEEEDSSGEEDSDDSSEDDSDSDDSDEESSDAEEDSDDNEDDSEEEEEEEEEKEPPKIRIIKNLKKKPSTSGRSTPCSVHSGGRRSREGTPKDGRTDRKTPQSGKLNKKTPQSGSSSGRSTRTRKRQSLDTSYEGQKRTSVGKRRRSESSDEEGFGSKRKAVTKSRGNEQAQQMKVCEDLVNELNRHEDAWPFLKPVSKKDAPDYYDMVKNPMDFSTMRNKINKFEYNSPQEVLEDIRLVFRNCLQYNMPTAQEYKTGQKLSKYFEKRVKDEKLETASTSNAKTNGPSPRTGTGRSRRH